MRDGITIAVWIIMIVIGFSMAGWGLRGWCDETPADPQQLDRIEAKLDAIIHPEFAFCDNADSDFEELESAANNLAGRQYKFLEVHGTCLLKAPLHMPEGTSIFGGTFNAVGGSK